MLFVDNLVFKFFSMKYMLFVDNLVSKFFSTKYFYFANKKSNCILTDHRQPYIFNRCTM